MAGHRPLSGVREFLFPDVTVHAAGPVSFRRVVTIGAGWRTRDVAGLQPLPPAPGTGGGKQAGVERDDSALDP